jgi:hypothetical protein
MKCIKLMEKSREYYVDKCYIEITEKINDINDTEILRIITIISKLMDDYEIDIINIISICILLDRIDYNIAKLNNENCITYISIILWLTQKIIQDEWFTNKSLCKSINKILFTDQKLTLQYINTIERIILSALDFKLIVTTENLLDKLIYLRIKY